MCVKLGRKLSNSRPNTKFLASFMFEGGLDNDSRANGQRRTHEDGLDASTDHHDGVTLAHRTANTEEP